VRSSTPEALQNEGLNRALASKHKPHWLYLIFEKNAEINQATKDKDSD